MSEPTVPPPRDPFGRAADLHAAWCDPALADLTTDAGEDAACRLAVALGNCRVEGIDPEPADDGTLPADVAAAAARALARRSARLCAAADRLLQDFDSCPEPLEFDGRARGLLAVRADLRAACVALDEAYESALVDVDPGAGALGAAIDAAFAELDRADQALIDRIDLLAVVADSHWLDNSRALLGPDFQEPLPWWLDGRIERAAARLEAAAARPWLELPEPVGVAEAPPRRRLSDTLAEMFALAAAGKRPAGAPTTFKYRSPDKKLTALIDLAPGKGASVTILAGETIATDLPAGTEVVLEGLRRSLRAGEATTEYPVAELVALVGDRDEFRFRLGGESEDWQPADD